MSASSERIWAGQSGFFLAEQTGGSAPYGKFNALSAIVILPFPAYGGETQAIPGPTRGNRWRPNFYLIFYGSQI